jgi:hypothetical protein
MISGLPRSSRIAPETQTRFPCSAVCGVPNYGAVATVNNRCEDLIRVRLPEVEERRPELRIGVEVA